MKAYLAAVGWLALVVPSVAGAQVVQTYTYDANGRLTGAATSGSAGTHTSAYVYDAANNRVSRSQTGASAWASLSRLPTNQLLQPDEALFSPDGRYSFALRPSGKMELWFGEEPAEAGLQPSRAAFDLTSERQARFAVSPTTSGYAADTWLALRDDGILILIDEMDRPLWASGDQINAGASQ